MSKIYEYMSATTNLIKMNYKNHHYAKTLNFYINNHIRLLQKIVLPCGC
jgi:hypothetical protein